MSSTTTSATIAAADGAATMLERQRQTYWCHECDMSVSFLCSITTTTSLRCPHCRSDFLEEMDSFPNTITNSDSDSIFPPFASILDHPFPILSPPESPFSSSTSAAATLGVDLAETPSFQFPLATDSDGNLLLGSPYRHRLIQHLTNSDSDNHYTVPTATATANVPAAARHQIPTAKSAIESLPSVKITSALLENDPIMLCAVCKDQFLIDVEAKQLPCKHLYHSDCILPWLETHNSCPVCRFQLPAESDGGGGRDSRRALMFTEALRLRGMMMDEEDLFGFGGTLMNIARRRRMVFPAVGIESNRVEEPEFSPTQIGEVEIGVSGRASSLETVSSWPSWALEGEAGVSVGGSGAGEVGVSATVNDDGDAVMF